jgi:GT2 family glycosyltransferase
VDDGLDVRPSGLNLNAEYVAGVKPFVFARNINIGIQEAGRSDVVLLNDDAQLMTPRGFQAMRSACVWPYGIMSATSHNVGNPNQMAAGPNEIHQVRHESRTLCFVCVYIPREVLDLVGPLDERFVDYGLDDDDYSLRVRRHGYSLGVFDGCYCDHHSLTSSYRGKPEAGGDFKPNLRRFIEKWGVDNWSQPKETSLWPDLFPIDSVTPEM